MMTFYRFNRSVLITIIGLLSLSSVASADLNLAIVYSGNEQGLIWAQGCDEQMGGLDRRHTLIKSLSEEHENVLNLHTGNIIDPFDPQSEVVYSIALEALSKMNYNAVCPGPRDLCLPAESLRNLHASHSEIPFICKNVDLEGQDGPLLRPYILWEIPSGPAKSVKVAVTSLISREHEMLFNDFNPGLIVAEPGFALKNLADELTQKSDYVVISLHATLENARNLAKEFPWIDALIVTQDEYLGSLEDSTDMLISVGETVIVTNSSRGKSVGVLEIEFDGNMQAVSKNNHFIEVSEQIQPSEELSWALALYDDLVENYGLDREAAVPQDQAIHIVYFYKRGCGKCAHFSSILRDIKALHPEVAIERKNVKENQELLEAMGEIYDVPEEKRLTTPALFIGDGYFLDELDQSQLEVVIEEYLSTGVESRLPEAEAMSEDARSRIISRFQSFGILTVAIAGLVDGINPCAFATIVLFVSYMSLLGRGRKEVLVTGIAFTSAVFVTYFLLGIGTMKFLEYLNSFAIVAKIIYLTAATATFVLAIVSFYDAYKVRRGKVRDIKLQLPKSLKDRIHRIIRNRAKTSSIVAGALVIGFAVSALELVCTGQVYLPTITFVAGIEGMRLHAILYLLLYNLMFIVPLLVVFGFVYLGTTFVQLGGVLQRHLMKVKLGTGLLLLGLSAWLIYTVVSHI